MTLNPDPLHVPEPDPPITAARSRRSLALAVLAALVVALAVYAVGWRLEA